MEYNDTIKLLRECDAGTKMAVSSIDEVVEKVCDSELRNILKASKDQHEKLEKEIRILLNEYGVQEKEPGTVAKGMSWMKTNMKMGMNNSDATVADLIIDGCNMGIKSLNKYLNQYKNAGETSKKIAGKLISLEEKLEKDLRGYL